MAEAPKKGSVEQALTFWQEEAPGILDAVHDLLKDTYNFQATGGKSVVTRAAAMRDGRTLRLYAVLEHRGDVKA